MNVTIAVSLITACSTLAGGVIASVTTFIVQKTQLRHQERLAVAERRETRNAELRAMRRTVFETLLNKYDELSELATDCWKDRPCISVDAPPNVSEIALEKGLRSFEEVLNSVMIEGSAQVIQAAHKAKQILREEMLLITQISLQNAGQNTSLHTFDRSNYGKCYDQRVSVKYEIIKAVAIMLESIDSQELSPTTNG